MFILNETTVPIFLKVSSSKRSSQLRLLTLEPKQTLFWDISSEIYLFSDIGSGICKSQFGKNVTILRTFGKLDFVEKTKDDVGLFLVVKEK